jgi:hypothetical protein
MKYVLNIALVASILLLGNLIYVATEKENFVVASVLAVPFLLICFVMFKFKGKIENFSLGGEHGQLAVNQKDDNEPS